jgi:nucleotide-binding universal stress UspA family protein
LAICLAIHGGNFSPALLVIQLIALALYALIVLFGLDWAGKEYFRRTGDEEGNQFLFVLLAVFLVSVGAQLINVEQIIGAFLAGLAINDVLGNSPVKEKIEFVGSTLFIPMFFVGMGLLLDVPVFIQTVRQDFILMLAIVTGLIAAKFLAAWAVKLSYRYNYYEGMTMWSLSLPQVAATLAAALAAYQAQNALGERLINEAVFNSVIVLMLVTSILGPLLTARFARNLTLPKPQIQPEEEIPAVTLEEWLPSLEAERQVHPFTIVIPISNPHTQRYLMQMAALLARHEAGTIIPLAIATAHVHMDDAQLAGHLRQGENLLARALKIGQEFNVTTQPAIRIDDDIAHGISRAAREKNASLIIMGWSKMTGLRARLFGSVIDSVFWSSHCPVAVMRLLAEPKDIHRLLVPIKNITPQTVRTIQFAQLFADANQAAVTLLHVCGPHTLPEQMASFKAELAAVVSQNGLPVKCKIKIIPHEDVARVIIRASHVFDLVILRSLRRRTAGGLAVSDVTTEVLKKLTCSLVLFGEPHS